jgi:ABC-2 type transport system ATP-binding protein
MDVLKIENLSKSFGGTTVIKDISLCVPEGSVFGFIGANGAGKTTTMKMALGLLKPDKGEIFICDEKVRFGMTETNRHVGYLPDVPEFYHYMRPKEYLKLCGEIVGLSDTEMKHRSDRLLELVGLNKVNKKIGGFSRGMKQRLGVAQALINEPKLLICDEPTSALDPVGRKEILDILRQISGKTTVIFSTHILSDVERICDRTAVIHHGKIILDGTLAELKAHHQADGLFIEFASADDKVRFCEKAPDEWLQKREDTLTELTLHVSDVSETQIVSLKILSQNDILPLRLERLEPSIENLYLEVVQ